MTSPTAEKLVVVCPACAARFRGSRQLAGRVVPCPKCSGRIAIPDPSARLDFFDGTAISAADLEEASSKSPSAPAARMAPAAHASVGVRVSKQRKSRRARKWQMPIYVEKRTVACGLFLVWGFGTLLGIAIPSVQVGMFYVVIFSSAAAVVVGGIVVAIRAVAVAPLQFAKYCLSAFFVGQFLAGKMVDRSKFQASADQDAGWSGFLLLGGFVGFFLFMVNAWLAPLN